MIVRNELINSFAKRILKAEFAISILNYNLGNKLFRYPSMKVNFDYKELVVSMMRGFKMD